MDIATLTTFFGWCTVLGIALLVITALALVSMGKKYARIHAKMFNLDEAELPKLYFNYLAHFKIAVIVFALVPWIALKIIGG